MKIKASPWGGGGVHRQFAADKACESRRNAEQNQGFLHERTGIRWNRLPHAVQGRLSENCNKTVPKRLTKQCAARCSSQHSARPINTLHWSATNTAYQCLMPNCIPLTAGGGSRGLKNTVLGNDCWAFGRQRLAVGGWPVTASPEDCPYSRKKRLDPQGQP